MPQTAKDTKTSSLCEQFDEVRERSKELFAEIGKAIEMVHGLDLVRPVSRKDRKIRVDCRVNLRSALPEDKSWWTSWAEDVQDDVQCRLVKESFNVLNSEDGGSLVKITLGWADGTKTQYRRHELE